MIKHTFFWLVLIVLLCGMSFHAMAKVERDNLAPNPSFEVPVVAEGEMPEGWEYFTLNASRVGITSVAKRSGKQSVRIAAQGIAPTSQGLILRVPVTSGDACTLSVFIKNNMADPLGKEARGMLVIEWMDEYGREITRKESKEWDRTLSKIRWTRFSIKKEDAPAGAVTAVFGIHLLEDKPGEGSFLVDDVVITRE